MVGREIDLAVLEFPDGRIETAPALEIHPDPEQPFFNAAAKYDSGATRFVVPAPLDTGLAARLRRTAIEAFEVLLCAGLVVRRPLLGVPEAPSEHPTARRTASHNSPGQPPPAHHPPHRSCNPGWRAFSTGGVGLSGSAPERDRDRAYGVSPVLYLSNVHTNVPEKPPWGGSRPAPGGNPPQPGPRARELPGAGSFGKLDELGSIQWLCEAEHPDGTPIMHEFTRAKGRFMDTVYVKTSERSTRKFPLILTTGADPVAVQRRSADAAYGERGVASGGRAEDLSARRRGA
ncbi:hypothetical protein JOF29_005666 [Kribbella aluminosa]|uniref:D-alanine--D-alanine ligase C-terminal domain-containing protein n=1 Tax=Kribbella aluminosa TaxID=416017 RepID=A0ABS4USF9_9ACTN|nr:hypothetical protein [Kribbella aluminosa]MBP2354556.1 hypothetical protein [Kribbella aluminosa]